MSGLVLLLVVLPFASAGLTLLLGHRYERAGRAAALAGSAIGFVLALAVAILHMGEAAATRHLFADTRSAGPAIALAVNVDQLSAVLLVLASTVAFLVQVYSLGYLASDQRYPSYAALVSVFTGAMTTVVVADDLWMLLVGWELMGACSYFLISHHWELGEARAGAVKAFLLTRTADLGLLFAILLLGERFSSYRISTILAAIPGQVARDELWLPAMLLAVAVIGKSAQFPLHTWLPDAMPGPTPISALIHAATMVAAGVFLVARTYPLFLSAPSGLNVLGIVAAITMVLSAVHALGATDLKRVLAWSTVSQLAYMFGALSVGAYAAAVLHLLAHGAFKALLFLGAGSVVHAVGSTSMTAMGALRRPMPLTFLTMSIGFGALAGVVPLSGFFTKDAVIGASLEATSEGHLVWVWVTWAVFAAAVVTAMLTMAYSLRAWLLVFFGPSSWPAEVTPTEPPWTMRVPLVVLSVPAAIGGVAVFFPTRILGPEYDGTLFHFAPAGVVTLLVAATAGGVVVAWLRAGRRDPWRLPAVPHPHTDRLIDVGVVRPVRGLARLARAGDRDVIEAYVEGAGGSARGLGRALRLVQNGNVQHYLMVVVVGAAAVAVVAGWRAP